MASFIRTALGMICGVVVVAGASLAIAADNIRITEMAVTTKVVKGNPIDSVHRISASSVKGLYCFTRISRVDESETTIKHVWYRDGQPEGETVLPVKGTRWRTYSKRPVDKGSSGAWRVDALASDGSLLKSVEFRIN